MKLKNNTPFYLSFYCGKKKYSFAPFIVLWCFMPQFVGPHVHKPVNKTEVLRKIP